MDPIQYCLNCSKPVNRKSRFCPHCGHENQFIDSNHQGNDCPHCQVPLQSYQYRSSKAEICPQCAGLWLDREDFNYLSSERDVYRDEDIPRNYRKPAFQSATDYLPCVRCHTPMIKKKFQEVSGIMIDICGDHGIWLDAGEMELIRTFIANGGLDKSQDHRIALNKGAIKDLANRVQEVEFTQRVLHFFDFKYWLFKIF